MALPSNHQSVAPVVRAGLPPAASDSCAADIVPTQEGYDRWSGIYDAEDNPLICLEQPVVERLIGDVAGRTVLDVGCGTGRWSLRLADAGATVTGIDFSTGMLDKARAKPGVADVRFVQHDLAKPLPFEDRAFDGVVCCLVLEHVPKLGPVLGEMKRVCRPDGFIVISDLHPAMGLLGLQARFVDPATGRETRPRGTAKQVSDYVNAVSEAGLFFGGMIEAVVDEALAARSPRSRKYLGWPMLLAMRLALSAQSEAYGKEGIKS